MKRRTLWALHSWLGLKLFIMMSFILVTGTLAVFSYEIDWLLNPEMRVLNIDKSGKAPRQAATWGQIYASAQVAYPDGKLNLLLAPRDPWWAVQAVFVSPSGKLLRVWIDPYSAEYRGVTGWFNVQRFLRQTHRHLMLPNAVGIPIVCMFSFVLIISMVTGIIMYKRFWSGYFRAPRFHRRTRYWMGDLHRLGAIWSLWFIPVIALTGLWYLTEKSLGGAAPPLPRPESPFVRDVEMPVDFSGTDLDRIVAVAYEHEPDLDVREISFPGRSSESVGVMGQAQALLVRNRANAVFVDPLTLTVTGSYRGEQLTVHQRLSEMADPLHFGTWGGLVTRFIWFGFGLVLSALSFTGVVIYGLRVTGKRTPGPNLSGVLA